MTTSNIASLTIPDSDRFDLDKVPAEARDSLKEMIPEARYGKGYTHRYITSDVNGAKYHDFSVFDVARSKKHNVLMPGPSGAGKTTAARAYAADNALPFVSVEFQGGFDFSTIIGSIQAGDDGLPRWIDGEVTKVLRYGGVIMLDEVNFAPPRFTAAFHGVLDSRLSLYLAQIGERVRKHPDCLILAAYNPGYLGTSLLNEAFKNRFAFTLPWGYDAEVENVRVGKHSASLLEMVRNMRSLDEMKGIDVGTNLMEEFILVARTVGIGLAAHTFLSHFDTDVRASVSDALNANLWQMSEELGVDADH